ncbi:MAG: Methicillin resistance protein [Parcubacteria group bacterium GW2011_GWA2_44_12]|nr:MAG: Methicillin resistance protein [Parcubacteria group bacterium GW2011_GWA2_44_12]
MSVSIHPIDDRGEWESFLESAAPQTFLHSWEWGEFNEALGDPVFRVGIYEHGALAGVALIIKVRARRGTFLFCPHGPLIASNQNEHVRALVAYLRALGKKEKAWFVRISSLFPDDSTHRAMFQKIGFRNAPIHMHSERGWILDITPSEDELLKNMRKDARYAIKKAQKDGVTVTVSRDIADIGHFWSIYQETVARQEFAAFSKKYIVAEFAAFQNFNNALLLFAYYKGEAIAGAMIIFTKNSAFYHHGASTRTHSAISGAHVLQWSAIREAKRRGCNFYNFWGIAPDNKPRNHPWFGLSHFKKGFGGSCEDYLHAQDLVLSPRYYMTYLIERIRRAKRGL